VKNIVDISRFSKGPIFLVGDLCQGGEEYAFDTIERLKSEKIKNEIVFEVFGMPSSEYLKAIDDAVENWSLELSPESHDEKIRRIQDEKAFYRNSEMEEVIKEALALRCHRIDVFFMIGLPEQTKESVMATIRYCDHLFQISDTRLTCFISPMGPFADPGSRCFEDPGRFGYKLFAHTLEEHRQLLVKPSWGQILNYETKWMSRDDLVDITYDAAEALNTLKLKYCRIDSARGQKVAKRIIRARGLKDRLRQSFNTRNRMSLEEQQILHGEIHDYSVSTVCDKRELFWSRHLMSFKWWEICRVAISFFFGFGRK
jgi:radical SAM superfamily enzyme YgiQ (UPF0313 family)